MIKTVFLLLSMLLVTATSTLAQAEVIYLENPSFEDVPRAGKTPVSWTDCGHSQESPPDIQPYGGFNVVRPPQDGRSYVGMVTRDNKTWEAVAQRLSKPIQKDKCYKFSLFACKSSVYISPTKKNQSLPTNFSKGIILRIWAGNNFCERAELLDEIEAPVDHTDWRNYEFELKPQKNSYNFICIEAYYKTPTFNFYNGNILVDKASEIFSCDIPTDEVVENEVVAEQEPELILTKPKDTLRPNNSGQKPPPNTSIKNLVIKDKGNFDPTNIKMNDLAVGDKFRLENLYFSADSSSINRNGEKVLFGLFRFLKTNNELALEIGGHTNGLPPDEFCDRLSTARAKSVVGYLQRMGIDLNRMSFKGYGKRKPIGNNDTKEGQRRNQRVEFIITDLE
jgi:outer membrane protein OmpA-like peptidoglycan-associated protein